MNILVKCYNNVFNELASQNSDFQEAFDIIRRNSNGVAWLIGGVVYRNLAHLLYGIDKAPSDFDFIVERPNGVLILPEGWIERRNKYGNPKFVSGDREIDFVPLSMIHSVIRRGLELTFPNYITGTPLTVQSIGYNIVTRKLESGIGINAIRTKTVAINNPEQAEIYARKKGKRIEDIIREKAESLGFTPIF